MTLEYAGIYEHDAACFRNEVLDLNLFLLFNVHVFFFSGFIPHNLPQARRYNIPKSCCQPEVFLQCS